MRAISLFFQSVVGSVREINLKYAKPQIHMTRFARFCLVSLRVYLVVLIGLMIFKFIMVAKN